tara:strand:- start:53 stop:205 length:153 start_codon:yes stop_codon:yes gene_type:complete
VISYLVYVIILLILIFVFLIAMKALSRGIKARKNLNKNYIGKNKKINDKD